MGLACVATRLFALANQVRCPASAYHKMGRGMQLLTTLVITAIIAKAAGRQKTLLEIRDLGALEGCGDLLGGDFSCPGHANGSAFACQLLNRNMGVDLCFQTPSAQACYGTLQTDGWRSKHAHQIVNTERRHLLPATMTVMRCRSNRRVVVRLCLNDFRRAQPKLKSG